MQHLNNFILIFYLDWYQGCWLFGAHWPWSAWVDYWWSSNWQNCRCHRHHYQPKEVQWWNRGQKETDVHLRCYRTKEVYRGPNRQAFDWRRCHEIHVNILILIIDILRVLNINMPLWYMFLGHFPAIGGLKGRIVPEKVKVLNSISTFHTRIKSSSLVLECQNLQNFFDCMIGFWKIHFQS